MKEVIAKIISAIFALPVTIFLIIYGVHIAGFNAQQFMTVTTQLLLLEIIIPFGIFAVFYARGLIGDIDVIDRRQRILPFIVAIIFFSISVILSKMTGNLLLFHFQLILLMLLSVSFVITLFWKISLHTGVITSAFIILLIFSGFQYAPLGIIIPLVYWSRLFLKRHTHGQLIAGIVVNTAITAGALYYLGYI